MNTRDTTPPGETVPSDPADVELPDIPSEPRLPDFGAIKADPSLTPSERLQIVILDHLAALSDTLLGPHGSLEKLRTEAREHRISDHRKVEELLEIVRNLVNSYSEHIQRDEEEFSRQEARLNSQRADIDLLQVQARKVEALDRLVHDAGYRTHDHGERLKALEARIGTLEQSVTDLAQGLMGEGK